jgi:hypothetical protein
MADRQLDSSDADTDEYVEFDGFDLLGEESVDPFDPEAFQEAAAEVDTEVAQYTLGTANLAAEIGTAMSAIKTNLEAFQEATDETLRAQLLDNTQSWFNYLDNQLEYVAAGTVMASSVISQLQGQRNGLLEEMMTLSEALATHDIEHPQVADFANEIAEAIWLETIDEVNADQFRGEIMDGLYEQVHETTGLDPVQTIKLLGLLSGQFGYRNRDIDALIAVLEGMKRDEDDVGRVQLA